MRELAFPGTRRRRLLLPAARRTGAGVLLRPVAGLTLVAFSLVASYSFALAKPTPHHLPVAIVGPAAAVQQVEAGLSRSASGSFSTARYPDAGAARRAILGRDRYGALVLGSGTTTLLVAGSAGPQAARVLEAAFAPVAAARGLPLRVVDVRPLPASDPAGGAPYFFQFGVLIPAFVFSVLAALLGRGLPEPTRLAVSGGFVVVCGLAATLAVDPLTETITGRFWPLAGVAMLLAAAVVGLGAGLRALLGPAGLAVSFVVLLVLGNPASGSTQPPEFLPDVYRQLSQWLPPGAALTAARNVAYFDGAALLRPALTLAAWATAGLAVIAAAAMLRGHRGRS